MEWMGDVGSIKLLYAGENLRATNVPKIDFLSLICLDARPVSGCQIPSGKDIDTSLTGSGLWLLRTLPDRFRLLNITLEIR